MTGQIFISLLNPGICALFATAFLLLWINQRHRRYVLIASLGYVATAMAFLLQDIVWPLPAGPGRIASNLCFVLAAYLLCAAALDRYRIAIPHVAMGASAGLAMAGLTWFLLADPDIVARILAISAGLGAIALITAVKLRSVAKPHLIDRLLFWVMCLTAANFIVRPIVIIWRVGANQSSEAFQQSIYWTTVQFTQAMISIMLALCLMVAVAIDLIADLKREAMTDKLSGLPNRRGFEDAAAAALRRSVDRGLVVSLMIADLDHFKQINDSHGHAVGDVVISLFGAAIDAEASESTVAGRIGGEEFAILLVDHDLGAARQFADRVRAAFARRVEARFPPPLSPTASIGLCVSAPTTDLSALLHNADLALYQAKQKGRDRVQVFLPEFQAAATGLAATAGRRARDR